MWRTFHILGRKQIFVVSSVSSAVIATSFVLTSMSHNQTGILRDLVWPHQFAPIIIFGAAFLSLLPILLAYYNLGRLGAILSLALSFVMLDGLTVGAAFLFLTLSPWQAAGVYLAACLLLYLVVLTLHMKAASSNAIRDAQRALRLVCYDKTQ